MLLTGQQSKDEGQKPGEVAKVLMKRGIRLYTIGTGMMFSRPQAVWSASYADNAYYSYNYQGKDGLSSYSKPLGQDIIKGRLQRSW